MRGNGWVGSESGEIGQRLNGGGPESRRLMDDDVLQTVNELAEASRELYREGLREFLAI